MSAPVQLAAVLLALIVSASAHVTVIGQPVPVLWLIAAAVVLALAAIVIVLIRSIVRDGGFLYQRPRMVNQ